MVAAEPSEASVDDAGPTSAAPTSKPGSVTTGYDNASQEIADIDSRLHALQNFLRSAKSSRP